MFKRCLLLFILIVLYSSSIFAKSRIIISGESSIIIKSKDNNTNVIANKIETVSGGKLIKTVGQVENSETGAEAVTEAKVDASISFYNGLPNEFTTEKAYPNPFNPTTRIRYGISTATSVNVAIYDMMGRLVSEYKIGDKTAGWHEFTWQGTNSHGQQVSTGMYLITMRAGDEFQKQKVTFLK